jgi:hypothetical protein
MDRGDTATGLLDRFIAGARLVERVQIDRTGSIVGFNDGFATHVGGTLAELGGQPVGRYLTADDAEVVREWLDGAPIPAGPVFLNFVRRAHDAYTLRCLVAREEGTLTIMGEPVIDPDAADDLMRLNNEFATLTRELERKSRQLEEAKRQLARALDELRAP